MQEIKTMADTKETTIKPQKVLDATGMYCPEPVMMLHSAIDEINTGEIIHVIATDPSTQRDIPKFCEFLGHELSESRAGKTYEFWITKG